MKPLQMPLFNQCRAAHPADPRRNPKFVSSCCCADAITWHPVAGSDKKILGSGILELCQTQSVGRHPGSVSGIKSLVNKELFPQVLPSELDFHVTWVFQCCPSLSGVSPLVCRTHRERIKVCDNLFHSNVYTNTECEWYMCLSEQQLCVLRLELNGYQDHLQRKTDTPGKTGKDAPTHHDSKGKDKLSQPLHCPLFFCECVCVFICLSTASL